MQNFILKIGATLMVLINFTVSSMTVEDAEAIAARPLSYYTEEDYETIARTEHISRDEAKTVAKLAKMAAILKMHTRYKGRITGEALDKLAEETGEDIPTLCGKSIALYSNPALNCDAAERIEAPKAIATLIEYIDAYSRKDLVRVTYLIKKDAHSDMVKLIMGLDAHITEKNTFISRVHSWIDSADLITSTTVPDNKSLSVAMDFVDTLSNRLAEHVSSQFIATHGNPYAYTHMLPAYEVLQYEGMLYACSTRYGGMLRSYGTDVFSTIDNKDLLERMIAELKS